LRFSGSIPVGQKDCMTIFKIIYWVGLFLEIVIRAPYQKTARSAPKVDRRISTLDNILLGLLSVALIILPLIYSVTNWLEFANYSLPAWMGWLGAFLLACGQVVFARSHMDLKSNWSPSLEIRKEHTLVTGGIYRSIRHPMYASMWIGAIAQILLLQNWLAGPLNLIFFTVFYFMRVRAEEKMMLDTFGSQYSEYMQRTGSVIPRWSKRR
jgi:protein-S-isoprenylcysteine O-methyltransferase Ste14